jgi:hypothetical protein
MYQHHRSNPASFLLLGRLSLRAHRGQLGQQVRPADSLQKRLVALNLPGNSDRRQTWLENNPRLYIHVY